MVGPSEIYGETRLIESGEIKWDLGRDMVKNWSYRKIWWKLRVIVRYGETFSSRNSNSPIAGTAACYRGGYGHTTRSNLDQEHFYSLVLSWFSTRIRGGRRFKVIEDVFLPWLSPLQWQLLLLRDPQMQILMILLLGKYWVSSKFLWDILMSTQEWVVSTLIWEINNFVLPWAPACATPPSPAMAEAWAWTQACEGTDCSCWRKWVLFRIRAVFSRSFVFMKHSVGLHCGLIHRLANLIGWTTCQCSERTFVSHYSCCILRVYIKWLKNNGIRSFVKSAVDVSWGQL